jgi:nucleotide-binding universal stress UspA family protein
MVSPAGSWSTGFVTTTSTQTDDRRATSDRFDSVSVPLDVAATGDRALVVARSLAELGRLPVDMFTVSSPGLDEGLDTWELTRVAELAGVERPTIEVLHGRNPAETVMEHVRSRPRALVVMGTSGKGALREWLFGSVTEEVLAGTGRPALVLGPHADAEPVSRPTLIVGVDDDATLSAVEPVLMTWHRTFPTSTILFATVVASSDDAGQAAARCSAFAEELSARGIAANTRVVHGDDVARSLELVADACLEPIIVAASHRWWGAAARLHSATMRLVRHSRYPILVIPATVAAGEPERCGVQIGAAVPLLRS